MTPTAIGIIGFIALMILIFMRMPVGFVMILVGFAGFACLVSWQAAMGPIAHDFFSVFNSYNLTVIPLFVFMGQCAFHSGISTRLFSTAHKFIGHLPGGLAVATVGACAAFSSICGSTSATAATMASVALPEMKKHNYDPALATGVVAAGGSLGILIPPSTIFIVYSIMTEQSIAKLFMAGVLPGIILALLFALTIVIWTSLKPEIGPRAEKFTYGDRLRSLLDLIETLILFSLVMGGLFFGIFTATEAGGVGALGTLLISLIRRNLSWEKFLKTLDDTIRITCMIMVIVTGATIFGHFLAVTEIPANIALWVGSLDLSPMAIMIAIIVIYILMGCLMDSLAMIMLTVPVFFPLVVSLGFDPIWFGVIIGLVAEIGVITPPIGINVYVVAGVARTVPLETIFKGTIWMMAALLITVALVLFFPSIALFLPGLMA
jgi:tripartite ATP-independent transporter DctM subunit